MSPRASLKAARSGVVKDADLFLWNNKGIWWLSPKKCPLDSILLKRIPSRVALQTWERDWASARWIARSVRGGLMKREPRGPGRRMPLQSARLCPSALLNPPRRPRKFETFVLN